MLPRDLQFELKPRRSLPWLKPITIAIVLLLSGSLLVWLVPRQQRLDQLRDELGRAQQQLDEARRPPPPPGPAPAWQANAEQDGRLFDLQMEPRLLEIERCTGPKVIVTRIVHDESTLTTSVELTLAETAELSTLLECLNTSDERGRPWRLSHVEASTSAATAGPGSPGPRVVLKRGP